MSSMKPRSYDDHVALFSLAQLHGYPVALAWSDDEHPRRPARAKRRSVLGLVRTLFARPAAEPQPCMTTAS